MPTLVKKAKWEEACDECADFCEEMWSLDLDIIRIVVTLNFSCEWEVRLHRAGCGHTVLDSGMFGLTFSSRKTAMRAAEVAAGKVLRETAQKLRAATRGRR